MKKIGLLMLVLSLSLTLTACGSKEKADLSKMTTEEIVNKLYDGMKDKPEVQNTELDSENLQYFIETNELEIEEGTASDAMINILPHSVVVLRLKDDANVEEVKKLVEESANPRKWVCVEAEEVKVLSRDNIVVLIMSTSEWTKVMEKNFKNL